MDLAVLSDIHGNYIALERCLEYAFSRGVHTFCFLGDYIGELAYPERTMQVLYDLKDNYQCYFIRGNKEEYWLDYRAGGEVGWKDEDTTTGALLYAYNELTSKDLDFFAQLVPVQEITLGGNSVITICHGSPSKINGKMLPDNDRTFKEMESVSTSLILCGHTHRQRKIIHNNKCVLNPGAVGISLMGEGKTQFMILHENEGECLEEFISLDYDVDRVIREMHEVDLYQHAPFWSQITESVLRGGNISHADVLLRAMELCKEETGKCIWPEIPEQFWAQAVQERILR